MIAHGLHGAVDGVTSTRGFEYSARLGLAVSGVLHLLVGYIIVRLAFGLPGDADQSGALATLAAQPGGAAALWVAAAGLLAMALWRLAEMLLGGRPNESRRDDSGLDRVKPGGLALVYTGLAISAIRFATGAGKPASAQNTSLTDRLLDTGGGTAALLMAAGVLIGVGGYHVYKGAARTFTDDLRIDTGTVVTALGVTGYIAKGIVLAGTGVLLVIAILTADPAKGAGLDAAVKSLGQAPFGRVLLATAAAGFASYGVFCFVSARCARM